MALAMVLFGTWLALLHRATAWTAGPLGSVSPREMMRSRASIRHRADVTQVTACVAGHPYSDDEGSVL